MPKIKCEICGKEFEDAYCDECYVEVSGVISELQSLNYRIENCQKTQSDKNVIEDLKSLLGQLKDEVEALEKKVKS